MFKLNVAAGFGLISLILSGLGACARNDRSAPPTVCSMGLYPVDPADKNQEQVTPASGPSTSDRTRRVTVYRSVDLTDECFSLIASTSPQNLDITVRGETAEESTATLLEVTMPPNDRVPAAGAPNSPCPWPAAGRVAPDNSFICKSLTYRFPSRTPAAGTTAKTSDGAAVVLKREYGNYIYASVSIPAALYTPDSIPVSLDVTVVRARAPDPEGPMNAEDH